MGAEREGMSATALLERLIIEGVDTSSTPASSTAALRTTGVPPWRLGPACGRSWPACGSSRVPRRSASRSWRRRPLSDPLQIRAALEFAARHPDDVADRIARHERAVTEGRRAADQRRALLA